MSVARKYMEIALDELRIEEVPCYDAQCSAVFKGSYFHEDVAVKSLGSGNSSHTSVSMFSDEPPHPELLLDLKQEVSVMRRLSHSNIVRFKGIVIDPPSIVLEYCEKGALWNLLPETLSSLRAKWEISSEEAWKWRLNIAIQIAKGMHYLHRQSPTILHNDLKSPNVFIDRNWCVKVGDFGSASMGSEPPSRLPDNNTWKSPEIMRGGKPTVKSDVFSFAVVLWELYTFERPWDNLCDSWDLPGKLMKFNKNRRIQEKVMSGERLKFPDTIIGGKCNGIQKSFKYLIEKCWKQRPKDRPDFAQIIESLTAMLQKLETPQESKKEKTRMVSMRELKEAKTSSTSFSVAKLSSLPQDPTWPPLSTKSAIQPTAKKSKSRRANSKWMLFNLSMKLVRKVRPLMGGGYDEKKKNLRSHMVTSLSSSSDSVSGDLLGENGPGYEFGADDIRSPFEIGPNFLKSVDRAVDWSSLCRGDCSIDVSHSSILSTSTNGSKCATAVDSVTGAASSLDTRQKALSKRESGASKLGSLLSNNYTLHSKQGIMDSMTAAENSLHDYFATESSSIDNLDAYIQQARVYHHTDDRQQH